MDETTWRAGAERLDPFLAPRGRAVRMPEGIRVWGERAARAGGLDATMGVITAPHALLGAEGTGDAIAGLPGVRAAFAQWDPVDVLPYAPVAGTRAFRQAWRGWIERKREGPTSLGDRLTLPVATSGVTGALCAFGLLALEPGQPVLVPDRRWDGYDTTFRTVAGARIQPVRLLDGASWALRAWESALETAARESGRAVCVANFPHNPTGYVPTAAEADAFAGLAADVAERTGGTVVVLCDDAYEGFVYTDRPRGSIFYRLVERHPRLLPVKCDGITKELLFWGGRLGAVSTALPDAWGDDRAAAQAVLENKLSAVVRGMISSASTPVQTLVARLLADPDQVVAARAPIVRSLGQRREAMAAALRSSAAEEAFQPDPFHGGLFALLNLRRGDAVEVAQALLARKIGVVPFRDPEAGLNAVRVTYATLPLERIAEVVEAAAAIALSG